MEAMEEARQEGHRIAVDKEHEEVLAAIQRDLKSESNSSTGKKLFSQAWECTEGRGTTPLS